MRLCLALLTAGAFAAPAGAFEELRIPAREVVLNAILFRPQGPGPFPAVVALHGCAGLGTPRSRVGLLPRAWGERLAANGYVALFPDSFGSRGAGEQCTARERRIRPGIERVQDANAARQWLQAQPWVMQDRVFLIGWSNGGSTVLWGTRPQTAPSEGHDFRSAIAFYPGCVRPGRANWRARIPTLILIGDADDWTPARECEALIAAARGRGAPVELVTYAGAHHAFDHPGLALRQRHGLAYTADGSGQAHIGSHPQARADAIERVLEWLAR